VDDHGDEVLEYTIVAGLLVLSSIAVIACIGATASNRWASAKSNV